MSVNGNEEPAGEMSPIQFSCNYNYSLLTHNKTPVLSTWGLLSVCAACPTPCLNLSSELRPSWEQYPRYIPHRVRNGYNNNTKNNAYIYIYTVGRDSSVGIPTRYGLEGAGIGSRWVRRDFPHPSRPELGSTQPPTQWVPGLLPRSKVAGAWRLLSTPHLAPSLKKW